MNCKKLHFNFKNIKSLIIKYLGLIVLLGLLFSCKVKTESSSIINKEKEVTWCPKDGVCSFETLIDKDLVLKHDEFGILYADEEFVKKVTLKFEYIKNKTPNTIDNEYREEVFVVLDPNNMQIEVESLKRVKVIFARWCYCKGQTGYYRVTKGKLVVKELEKDKFKIDLNFKVDDVPQIICQISEVFKLP